jgi:hypothetical protein
MPTLKIKPKGASNSRVEKMREEMINPKSLKALNLLLDGALLKEFKMKTVRDGTTMTEVLTGCIVEYVDES